MKANFKISKSSSLNSNSTAEEQQEDKKKLSKAEFEEFILKTGAAGSFMVFRSDKKEDELGVDQL